MIANVLRAVLALWVLVSAGAAHAEWHEASSDHFLVIADQNEKDVREFTERLERFHSAVHHVLQRENTKPSPSNRVTIYVVRSASQVQKLAGDKSGWLQGFYQARAGGSLAFTSRVDADGKAVSQSEQILFHEYTHHVMHGVSEWATPRWLSEGFAEFFSTARFEKNGGVGLGLPSQNRLLEIEYARNIPIEALLDTKTYQALKRKGYDEFYGRSWLLYHYLQLSGNRKGQLATYQVTLANGATELEAANKAFGDLKLLDKELDAYSNRHKMRYLPIAGDKLRQGAIAVRKLRAGEMEMMPVILESKRGVTEELAKALLPKAQAVAVKYPDDPTVLAAVAEAEHDAGNYAVAIATADKALSIAPTQINAHVQKIFALSQLAETADAPETQWKRVRKATTMLNKVEPDHPIPLIYYYRSLQGSENGITDLASHGLQWALQLAPYDQAVRWQVVQQLVDEEAYGAAYRTLMPLANDPHNRGDDNPAIALLADIKKKWEGKIAAEKETSSTTSAATK